MHIYWCTGNTIESDCSKRSRWTERRNNWRPRKSTIQGKPIFLSLCLAACVININSTKLAVIKLLRVVNDPQRQNRNIKGHKLSCTSSDMQPNIYFQYVPPPTPTTTTIFTLKHPHAVDFWLAEQSEILLLTFVWKKRESELNKICFS